MNVGLKTFYRAEDDDIEKETDRLIGTSSGLIELVYKMGCFI